MIVCKNHQYVRCTLLGTYIIVYICLLHFFKYKVRQYINSSITTSYHDDDPTIQDTLTLSVEYTVHSSVCECFRIIVNLLSIILYLSSILSIPILPHYLSFSPIHYLFLFSLTLPLYLHLFHSLSTVSLYLLLHLPLYSSLFFSFHIYCMTLLSPFLSLISHLISPT